MKVLSTAKWLEIMQSKTRLDACGQSYLLRSFLCFQYLNESLSIEVKKLCERRFKSLITSSNYLVAFQPLKKESYNCALFINIRLILFPHDQVHVY